MKVSTVEMMRSLDKGAMEKYHIPDIILMENAGNAAYFVIHDEFGIKGKRFVVFCGIGNNGGDGFVVARKLHSNGGIVTVFLLSDSEKLKGCAKDNFDILASIPVNVERIPSIQKIKKAISDSDALVDAIFGTGLARDIAGSYKKVIELINKGNKPVFSIDIPSGVNGNTGQIMGCAVNADYTVTFGLPKLGNLLYPGFAMCGKLYVTHISFPPSHYNNNNIRVETNDLISLPQRSKDTHKGDYGKALFIAGSSNYCGAPYFCALSFLKAGGGLSYLASPKSITPFLANKGSEIVFVPQIETDKGSLSKGARNEILEFSDTVDIVIIGPGLSLNEETQELVRGLAADINKPMIIDGDGITAISKDIDIIKNRKQPTVLTPHLGEMSRITKMGVDKIQKDRISILFDTSMKLNAYIILKGAHTLISYPGDRIFINMSGNPGMATAGSGDVLAGTVAAMFGLGLSIKDSIRMGVFVHGFSGDLAARDIGEDGITANDIMNYLPGAIRNIRVNIEDIAKNIYEGIYIV